MAVFYKQPEIRVAVRPNASDGERCPSLVGCRLLPLRYTANTSLSVKRLRASAGGRYYVPRADCFCNVLEYINFKTFFLTIYCRTADMNKRPKKSDKKNKKSSNVVIYKVFDARPRINVLV